MQVLRRSVLALCAATGILALIGCGGLGVNIGSGTGNGSQVVSEITIQTQVPPNIPTVVVNHTILMTSVVFYKNGSTLYVSSTQGTQWAIINSPGNGCPPTAYPCTTSAKFTGGIALLMGDCVTPYDVSLTHTVCVLGLNPIIPDGAVAPALAPPALPATAGLTTSLQGKTAQVTITVQ